MWYAVYETDTGRLRSSGSVVADPLPEGLSAKVIPARTSGMDWNPETLDFDVPREIPGDALSPGEFMDRFTLDEDVAIETAAQSDPMLRVFLRRVQSNPRIRLDAPLVQQGLGYLVSVGILTQARAGEIGGD